MLLEALPAVRRQVPDVRLEVVGDGDDVGAMRRHSERLGLDDVVEWSGRIPHERLPEAYRRAAVTVLPSLTEAESFGMTLVEAMACGCPVVGSEVGGIPFVVRDGVDGLLVPPGDSAALAGVIVRLLRDRELRATLGRAGVEAARGRWDWAHRQETHLRFSRRRSVRR